MPRHYNTSQMKKLVGEELRRLRRAAGLKQAEAAELLGVSEQQYGKYERGENLIPMSRLDIARGGFQSLDRDENGFSEETADYSASPYNLNQALKSQWTPLRSYLLDFVKFMDDLFGV